MIETKQKADRALLVSVDTGKFDAEASLSELCELCEEDKATISRGLDFLEENGYIVCEKQQGKRYKSALLLTEKGIEVGKKIADKINFVLNEVCVDLTEAQRAEFYSSLAVISDNLELCTKGIQKAKKNKQK